MTGLVDQLRADLTTAMRERDVVAMRVLRSALGAIANAEALPVDSENTTSLKVAGGIAGASDGLRATEAPRRTLGDEELLAVVRRERDERLETAVELDARGASERGARLRVEAEILTRYLS